MGRAGRDGAPRPPGDGGAPALPGREQADQVGSAAGRALGGSLLRFLLLALLILPGAALASPPDLRLLQQNALRYEPVGAESQTTALVRWRLYDGRESVLLKDCGVGLGLQARVNPAFPSVGPAFEISPLAVLILRGGVDFIWFDGGFGFMQSWPKATDPALYLEPNRAATAGDAYMTTGTKVWMEPVIQAMVWRIAVRTLPGIEYYRVDLKDGDTVWYSGAVDAFVPGRGVVWSDHTDVLYVDGPFVVGARWSGVWPVLDSEPVVPVNHSRVGPLFAWNPKHPEGKPAFTLFAVAGWYLNHPNRGGPVPYTAGGVSWAWDTPLRRMP